MASKVLKEKDFPKVHFSKLKWEVDPLSWRSILAERPLLEKGTRWRVGNGTKIKIWKDKWIPRLSSFKIHSLVRGLENKAIVNELIDPDTKQWKVLINEIFFKIGG